MATLLDCDPRLSSHNSQDDSKERRHAASAIHRFSCFSAHLFLLAAFTLSVDSSLRAADPIPSQPKSSAADEAERLKSQLLGSWRIVSASFDGKPSELHKTSITLKHITPVHVIWIGYQPNDRRIFRSAGGSWKIEDGKYVETMLYGLDEKFKDSTFGKSFAFDCRFEKDRWVQSGKLPNGVFLEEIWERVRENQDVDQRPDGQQPK